MKKGTPAQRQFSISRRSATYVSVAEVGGDALDRQVAVVLAADVVGRGRLLDRPEEPDLRVLDRLRSPRAGASIAQRETTCMRWFTTTSRSAPTGS
jgi:hypothetical protein